MISVLVVDDSVVIRRLVTDALAEDPKIKVVGAASNGRIALAKIEQLRPDIVTLDVEMPVMDGLETLRVLRPKYPRLPVIMFSTLTASGATATLDALAAGATDYVTKPANVGSIRESIRSVREQLIPRIHALCAPRSGQKRRRGPLERPPLFGRPLGEGRPPLLGPTPGARPEHGARPLTGQPDAAARPDAAGGVASRQRGKVRLAGPIRPRTGRVGVVAIGSSTGGPDALTKILRMLPKDWPVPIVVVQHMPPVFTKMFSERLDRICDLTVVEAMDNMPVWPGSVYIAPGDLHLEVVRKGQEVATRVKTGPPENFCRPAVDVLFRSVNTVYGQSTLAVILTGMGHDGQRACEGLHAAGAEIVAQDEASSVVWGMPGAVASAGLADAVLPLDEMASHLIARVTGGRRTSSVEVTR
ncbi:MAG: chemotaxis response regulator protein-glutamate methylesterase [Micromonosporaceae bacterium]|nr:chemotaxis response regulator protein-glutamate methylesterase [Micromonosporaceae bacterium]